MSNALCPERSTRGAGGKGSGVGWQQKVGEMAKRSGHGSRDTPGQECTPDPTEPKAVKNFNQWGTLNHEPDIT